MLSRYEILDAVDLPFPLGGCFGYWGYDLKNFLEPGTNQWAVRTEDIDDAWLGFYDSLMVFDHVMDKSWLILTGMDAAGNRSRRTLQDQSDWWDRTLEKGLDSDSQSLPPDQTNRMRIRSSLTRESFIQQVLKSCEYIRKGHIYQVNLAQKITCELAMDPWEFYKTYTEVSTAPFGAWIHCGSHQLASASPEQFLKISGNHITSCPIKGTRPRGFDAAHDALLAYELQTSSKEISELVMITDLLRNDLGKICEYGTITVPHLLKLEKFAHVQHLISTVEGELRPKLTHAQALASVFPGGSITGAPKIRAMQIIDELEPVTRGPYTGCIGYLGFNRESQVSIAIRTAVLSPHHASYHAGSGIVADSIADQEYDETLHKSLGFFEALRRLNRLSHAIKWDNQPGFKEKLSAMMNLNDSE